jgi:threonine/homoserine/homoserine lactone efflux protein
MPGISNYAAFVVAIIVFLAIPGPGNIAIIASTSKGRLAGGVAALLGLMVGDQVLMALAVAGVAALLASTPAAFHAVQWLGAGYLAFIGWKLFRSRPGDAPVLDIKPRHYFRQAFLITLLNPKAIVFYMAFFPLFIDPQRQQGLATFAVMALTVSTLTLVYGLVVVALTQVFAQRLRASPRVVSAMQKVAGVSLIGFAVKLASSK